MCKGVQGLRRRRGGRSGAAWTRRCVLPLERFKERVGEPALFSDALNVGRVLDRLFIPVACGGGGGGGGAHVYVMDALGNT